MFWNRSAHLERYLSIGYPLPLKTAINVLKIAQFDENLNTITLNVLLSVAWSDTRIRLESNKPNPYVFKDSDYIIIYEWSFRDRTVTVWQEPIWTKVKSRWQILPQRQSTYLRGPESASIKIPLSDKNLLMPSPSADSIFVLSVLKLLYILKFLSYTQMSQFM